MWVIYIWILANMLSHYRFQVKIKTSVFPKEKTVNIVGYLLIDRTIKVKIGGNYFETGYNLQRFSEISTRAFVVFNIRKWFAE